MTQVCRAQYAPFGVLVSNLYIIKSITTRWVPKRITKKKMPTRQKMAASQPPTRARRWRESV
jgi:hypothetical protein